MQWKALFKWDTPFAENAKGKLHDEGLLP